MGKNLILIGFMGCGKTSVGKRLAKATERKFVDIDRYIEEKENRKVSEIFAAEGEPFFRQLETQAVKTLSQMQNLIIACGGGTVLRRENVDAFHATGGLILFLDVPIAVLQQRLKNDTKRPLLQQPNRERIIEKLHRERYPLYRKAADVRLYSGAFSQTVVKRVLAMQKVRRVLELPLRAEVVHKKKAKSPGHAHKREKGLRRNEME